MKASFMLAFIASLSFVVSAATTTSLNRDSVGSQLILTTEDPSCRVMIGAGLIGDKINGNCTIQSDDGNTYQAVMGSYLIGDYVYHTDPVGGWVIILGLVH